MKKFKNVRVNDIITVANLTTDIFCVVNRIVKYDTENNTITLEITDIFTDEKYITPVLYMNVCHVADTKSNTYETTELNMDTLAFMCAINDEYLSDYDEALMQYKYNTIHTYVNNDIYDRDNVDKRKKPISCVLDNSIQHFDEMSGYYEYIQRVRPKRIEKLIFHTDGVLYEIQ